MVENIEVSFPSMSGDSGIKINDSLEDIYVNRSAPLNQESDFGKNVIIIQINETKSLNSLLYGDKEDEGRT